MVWRRLRHAHNFVTKRHLKNSQLKVRLAFVYTKCPKSLDFGDINVDHPWSPKAKSLIDWWMAKHQLHQLLSTFERRSMLLAAATFVFFFNGFFLGQVVLGTLNERPTRYLVFTSKGIFRFWGRLLRYETLCIILRTYIISPTTQVVCPIMTE